MSENIWDKWDATINGEQIKRELEDLENQPKERKEVPKGRYEVRIKEIFLKESKSGKPMVTAYIRVISEGEYKGQTIFMNQCIDTHHGVHHCNEFLRSLKSDCPVAWTGKYGEYAAMLAEVVKDINDRGLEYQLNYTEEKGYDKYIIEQVFNND